MTGDWDIIIWIAAIAIVFGMICLLNGLKNDPR